MTSFLSYFHTWMCEAKVMCILDWKYVSLLLEAKVVPKDKPRFKIQIPKEEGRALPQGTNTSRFTYILGAHTL